MPCLISKYLIERVARTTRSERRGNEHSHRAVKRDVLKIFSDKGCRRVVEFKRVILFPGVRYAKSGLLARVELNMEPARIYEKCGPA